MYVFRSVNQVCQDLQEKIQPNIKFAALFFDPKETFDSSFYHSYCLKPIAISVQNDHDEISTFSHDFVRQLYNSKDLIVSLTRHEYLVLPEDMNRLHYLEINFETNPSIHQAYHPTKIFPSTDDELNQQILNARVIQNQTQNHFQYDQISKNLIMPFISKSE